MRSTPLLIEAKPTRGYVVHVRFEDDLTADIDLSYLLDYGGVFEPLRNLEYFRQLRTRSLPDHFAPKSQPTQVEHEIVDELLLATGQQPLASEPE